MVDCVLGGNEAIDGGGLYFSGTNVVVQCAFSGNRADNGAGCGARNSFSSHSIKLANCTFSRNIAASQGGAVGLIGYGHIVASNSIFWRNSVGSDVGETAQFALGDGDIEIDYSCVGGWTGAFGGEGNLSANPEFIDAPGADGLYGTVDDDLRLLSNSPCIDAAGNSWARPDAGAFGDHVLSDLSGSPRYADDPSVRDTGEGHPPIIDIGAHERPSDG